MRVCTSTRKAVPACKLVYRVVLSDLLWHACNSVAVANEIEQATEALSYYTVEEAATHIQL
jgi:hypothetical protein